MIIAVDGTAASGKGTLARGLAKQLNLAHLDTGTLYRGVALQLLQQGLADSEASATEAAAITVAKKLQPSDLNHPRLRDEATAKLASGVAKIGGVRAALLAWQRDFANKPPQGKKGAVLDGRDIGTVVLPHADVKFFCDAAVDIRAQRRYNELLQLGEATPYANVLRDMRARDTQDSTRSHAPLTRAEDAIVIDTGKLSVAAMIKFALTAIQTR